MIGKDFCKTCAKNKITKSPYPISSHRAEKVLELVHSDICGPFEPSLRGFKYFVTFIDDKSNMIFLDALKFMSDVIVSLRSFLELVIKQREEKIQAIGSDNALEYSSKEFETILEKNRIQHQFSVSYSTQQNGKAEKMNRTIRDMIRCMLDQARLPSTLWAGAARTAAYLRNRLPAKTLVNMTPYEV